ncbi:MAG: hypothetical protein JWN68_2901 [Nocardioides sp.]|jgi:uncharacterized membrane protein (TIGR02234 family)|uniref:Trp biosynthesis-associated membrane protein n=1 Tax=Nocardioides sp. TaxID=35761 RepID=UPI0026304DA2|nr:Trp biosynthesis-associated membrane protein [Nocardioides sp.]MCW2834948.1 hypothetical protein [Nocardioides sp.]
MAERSRTFGPVLLVGLTSAGLAAVAGARPWVELSASSSPRSSGALASTLEVTAPGEMPLAGALSLVLLACWGVVLVTRGRVRRAMAVLAAITALGLLITTIVAVFTLPDSFREQLQEDLGSVQVDSTFTAWYAAALVAAVLSVVSTVAAVRYLPTWPEMGSRYDAPAGDSAKQVEPEGNLELWKALDEGHDPTASQRPLD